LWTWTLIFIDRVRAKTPARAQKLPLASDIEFATKDFFSSVTFYT